MRLGDTRSFLKRLGLWLSLALHIVPNVAHRLTQSVGAHMVSLTNGTEEMRGGGTDGVTPWPQPLCIAYIATGIFSIVPLLFYAAQFLDGNPCIC